jgi:hypothetical protein
MSAVKIEIESQYDIIVHWTADNGGKVLMVVVVVNTARESLGCN